MFAFLFGSPPPRVEFRRLSKVDDFLDDGSPKPFAEVADFAKSDIKMVLNTVVEAAREGGAIPDKPWPFASTLTGADRERGIEVVLAEYLGLGSLELEGNKTLIRKLLDKPLQATEPFLAEDGTVVYVRPPEEGSKEERYVNPQQALRPSEPTVPYSPCETRKTAMDAPIQRRSYQGCCQGQKEADSFRVLRAHGEEARKPGAACLAQSGTG